MRGTKIGAIVIGGYVNALNVVRALAAQEIPVAVITSQPYDVAHRSRWVSEQVPLERFAPLPDPLMALLRENASLWKGRVLLPTMDLAVETLARHREELSRHYRIPVLPWEVTSILLLKNRTREAANRAGVPVPVYYGPACPELLDVESPRFPLLVKPTNSYQFQEKLGRKLLVANSPGEYQTALDLLERHGLSAEVHDLVPGPDTNYFNYVGYLDRERRPVAEMVLKKLRKAPARFGVGRVVTNEVEESIAFRLREHTLALLDEIGWQGPVSAEFKLDPRDGELRLIEVNGRCALMMGIARRMGLNIPRMIYEEAVGGEVTPVRPNEWKGVWIHLHADILHPLFFHQREGYRVKDYLSSYCKPRVCAVWSVRDPFPFLAQWSRSLKEFVRLPFNPKHRRRLRRQNPQIPRPNPRDHEPRQPVIKP